MKQIIIQTDQAGQRLDKFLQKYLKYVSKGFIYKMLRKKNIVLNGKKAEGSEKLSVNDELKLFFSDETLRKFTQSEKLLDKEGNEAEKNGDIQKLQPEHIIYENEHICLLNKPCGILSQKAGKEDVSLNEWFVEYWDGQQSVQYGCSREQYGFRPALCNRLDRNTSGIVVGGKTIVGLQKMAELLRERSIRKYYLCLVAGTLSGICTMKGYLRKEEQDNKVYITKTPQEGADYIETTYRAVSGNGRFTLLEVELMTGRTHQIRVHLSSIGHPCVGDGKYGEESVNRRMRKQYGLRHQLLHSYRLLFPRLSDPFGDLSEKEFVARPPELFDKIIKGEGIGYGDVVDERT